MDRKYSLSEIDKMRVLIPRMIPYIPFGSSHTLMATERISPAEIEHRFRTLMANGTSVEELESMVEDDGISITFIEHPRMAGDAHIWHASEDIQKDFDDIVALLINEENPFKIERLAKGHLRSRISCSKTAVGS